MRFFWRSEGIELGGHAAWLAHLEDKNRKPGTSAPTLASAWSGPVDLLGALASHADLGGARLECAVVEEKASFDSHGGNVRNHDAVLRGVTVAGDRLVVCVEAKSGEPLGLTVAEQAVRAAKAKQANSNSNASARISDLVERLCRYPLADSRVSGLRYQLLTAWAGTLATAAGSAHAVFALHEFRTNERPEDKSLENGAELARLADVVLGGELPAPGSAPWCVRVPDVVGVSAALYVTHVVTDLRAAALGSAPKPSG